MFSTTAFWALFWAEVLTTFWTSLGGPIDYNLPYPTRFSYVGEHVIVWMAVVFVAHFALSQIKKSPFSIAFTSVKVALTSYVFVGLLGELAASLFLWQVQSRSPRGVTIWIDPINPHHVLRSFIVERLTTWVVVFLIVFSVAYAFKGKQKALNQR
jgi:predicted neutral ceramidase superfamily lipid hydrolase